MGQGCVRPRRDATPTLTASTHLPIQRRHLHHMHTNYQHHQHQQALDARPLTLTLTLTLTRPSMPNP